VLCDLQAKCSCQSRMTHHVSAGQNGWQSTACPLTPHPSCICRCWQGVAVAHHLRCPPVQCSLEAPCHSLSLMQPILCHHCPSVYPMPCLQVLARCCAGRCHLQQCSLTIAQPYGWTLACLRETPSAQITVCICLLSNHRANDLMLQLNSIISLLSPAVLRCAGVHVLRARYHITPLHLQNCTVTHRRQPSMTTLPCCVVLCPTDPMIAKIVTHGPDRNSALQLLRQALADTQVCQTIRNCTGLLRRAVRKRYWCWCVYMC
jgi:hypothetical protein